MMMISRIQIVRYGCFYELDMYGRVRVMFKFLQYVVSVCGVKDQAITTGRFNYYQRKH